MSLLGLGVHNAGTGSAVWSRAEWVAGGHCIVISQFLQVRLIDMLSNAMLAASSNFGSDTKTFIVWTCIAKLNSHILPKNKH